MEVRLLGAMEAAGDDGSPLAVPGAKLRALLAMLALDAGRVVSTDRLIEGLWQDDPPAGVANSLQRLVSKLRNALGSGDLVAMRPPGYVLAVEPDNVDVHRLDRLATEAHRLVAAGDLVQAVDRCLAAEALWRGPALVEFAYDEFALAHITRLHEVRLSLVEDRVDAEQALGRHLGLVGDLEALVTDNPTRERFRGQLMLALYREGRQAEALRVFQDGRTILAEELGLEPGPALRELEAAILRHDPVLEVVSAAPAGPVPVERPRRRTNARPSLTRLVGRPHRRHREVYRRPGHRVGLAHAVLRSRTHGPPGTRRGAAGHRRRRSAGAAGPRAGRRGRVPSRPGHVAQHARQPPPPPRPARRSGERGPRSAGHVPHCALGFTSSFSRAPTTFDVPVGESTSLSVLGLVAEVDDQAATAIDLHRAAYHAVAATADPRAIPLALEGLAAAVVLDGDARWAAQLLGCSATIRATFGTKRAPTEQADVDRVEHAAIAQIGDDAFATAFAEGTKGAADGLVTTPIPA